MSLLSFVSRFVIGAGLVGLLATVPSPHDPQSTQNVSIIGMDYAYVDVPQTLAPGPTAFSFENRGKRRHMMLLARLKPGVTLDSAHHAIGPARAPLLVGGEGALTAMPGERAVTRLLVDLIPGQTYVMYCVYRDGPDKPQHEELGMFASFVVK